MFNSIKFLEPEKLSPWRKISLGSWRPNGASSIFVKETLDLENFQAIKKRLSQTDESISFNAYFANALGKTLIENQRINSMIRLGRIYPRKDVSMFFHVLRQKNLDDLSGVKIEFDNNTDIASLESQFKTKISECKKEDKNFVAVKNVYKFIPSILSKTFLDITSFLTYTLNLNLKFLGVPKDSFGSIMVTNVSSLGLELAFTPIAPYTKIPVVIAVGTPSDRCVVKNGQMCISKQLDLGIHFDHRLIDGAQISDFLNSLRKYLYEPTFVHEENIDENNDRTIPLS
jgi:pyruvate dehydrogenase E2 component (dihydrolipoamide acetyltransferase)